MHDNTFVGFSKNTGEWPCKHTKQWKDLTAVNTCETRKTNKLAYQIGIDNTFPRDDMYIYWYKSDDDVYRAAGFDQHFPMRGIALYDTWFPTYNNNNIFWNYPSKTNFATAIGAHLSNAFGMVNNQCWMEGNIFHNVDRPWHNSVINSTVNRGDSNTYYEYFGQENSDPDNPDVRFLADGELTQACVDVDGHIFGEENSMIIPENYTLLYEESCHTHDTYTGLLCPNMEMAIIRLSVAPKTYNSPMTFQRLDKVLPPTTLTSGIPVGDGRFTLNGNANTPYIAKFVTELPRTEADPIMTLHTSLEHTNTNQFFRISYCMNGAVIVDVEEYSEKARLHGEGGIREPVDNSKLLSASNLQEMEEYNDGPSWYFDGDWFHAKLVQYTCRGCAGTFFNPEDQQEYEYGNYEHRTCNPGFGCHQIRATFNVTTSTPEYECSDFTGKDITFCNNCSILTSLIYISISYMYTKISLIITCDHNMTRLHVS